MKLDQIRRTAPTRVIAGATCAAVLALAGASATHGQSAGAAGGTDAPADGVPAAPTKITPPAPGNDAIGSPLGGYGMALVLTLMVVGASIIPSKRAHTDL